MFLAFRQSMAWLHTWIGLVFGALLFLVCLCGSLTVFEDQIDRWMTPATRLAPPLAELSLDDALPMITAQAGASRDWNVDLPHAADPVLHLRYKPVAKPGAKASRSRTVDLDPTTGEVIPKLATQGGGFFFNMHYSLKIGWKMLGFWIVGLAASGMVLSTITALLIHARLIPELFTFRPKAQPHRRALDFHTLTGVAVLPFLMVMSFSGLWLSYTVLMPSAIDRSYPGDRSGYFADALRYHRQKPAGEAATLAPLDPMMAQARALWGGGRIASVQVREAGDAKAYVEINRRGGRITTDADALYFDGVTGELIKRTRLHPPIAMHKWITGLHQARFDRPALSWLYFLMGLTSCAVIGSGLVVWTEGRRLRHHRDGLAGAAVVSALTLAAVTGPLLAVCAYLIANRLLPEGLEGRGRLEIWAFFAVWIAAAIHAALRGRKAWREQVLALGVLAAAAPVSNWLTTGGLPFRSPAAVTGVDLTLLAAAALSGWIGVVLLRREQVP